jgi:hypothetical protein
MTTVARYTGDVRITGDLQVDGSMPTIERADLQKRSAIAHPVDLTQLRVHDALHTVLPGTAADDDLALDGGTFGTDAPIVSSGDLADAGATTRYARFVTHLPQEYVDGDTITLRFSAGMEVVADDSATLDVECYKSDREGSVGSDICTTAAQSMNDTSFVDLDFTITPTGMTAGDQLDVRIAMAINDAATGSGVIGVVGAIDRILDIRG